MIKGVFILMCLICSVFGVAQNNLKSDTFVIKNDTISIVKGSRMTTDYLNNLYVVSPTNDIIKYDKKGKKVATVNYKVLGNIMSIDASNPFEIYVFYRDQNQVVFLDNLLNMRGSCDLESIGVSQIACVSRSSDNQIWLFDLADMKLKKYSKDLKLLLESGAFNALPIGNFVNPTQILDNNNHIYILNLENVLEFDIFANFSKIIFSDTMNSFQWKSNEFIYFKNGSIQVFNPKNFRFQEKNIEIPKDCQDVRIEEDQLFFLCSEYLILQTYSRIKK